jgi:hypothetical protein
MTTRSAGACILPPKAEKDMGTVLPGTLRVEPWKRLLDTRL